MINRLGRDCEVISEARDVFVFIGFDGTGVVDLEWLPIIVADSKEALGVSCADEFEFVFMSVGNLDSRECRLGFTVDKGPVCGSGEGCRGASGGIGNFVMGPK